MAANTRLGRGRLPLNPTAAPSTAAPDARVPVSEPPGSLEPARFAKRPPRRGREHPERSRPRDKRGDGIGLDPATLRLALSIHERHPRTTHARIGFAFEPATWEGEPVNAEPGKCSELVWVHPADLPLDTVGYTAVIINAVERATTFALNGW
jgi:hypothetical protein